jgi:DNA-binding beta-propeller fold protein YncE
LFTFARSVETGALTEGTFFAAKPLPPCATLPVLGGPADVLVPPDGRNVYVVGTYGTTEKSAILVFERQNATSPLVLLPGRSGCLVPSGVAGTMCREALGLRSTGSRTYGPGRPLAISPDGRTLYLSTNPIDGSGGGEIVALERDVARGGGLRPAGHVLEARGPFADYTAITPSRDGRYLYVTGEEWFGTDDVVVYRRR